MCIAGGPPAHKNATAWPASNHPFEVGATVSRIARVNKMAAARMLRPSIVVPSIVIPSWSAARLPGQRRHNNTSGQNPEPPFRFDRNATALALFAAGASLIPGRMSPGRFGRGGAGSCPARCRLGSGLGDRSRLLGRTLLDGLFRCRRSVPTVGAAAFFGAAALAFTADFFAAFLAVLAGFFAAVFVAALADFFADFFEAFLLQSSSPSEVSSSPSCPSSFLL